MTYLVIGLLLFLGVHSVGIFSPGGRDRIVARIGAAPWRAVYSVLAVAGFVLTIHGYGVARQSPQLLYAPAGWTRHVAALVMLAPFPLLLAAYLPGRIKARLRHPMLWAVVIWASAHLLANGMLADVLLFGGLLLWAAAELISFKYRSARPIRTVPSRTSNDGIAIALGLLVYLAFVLGLHARLIGVAPFPM
jgi:uncharacterized membrane protein